MTQATSKASAYLCVAALSALYPAPPILALAIVGPLAKAMDLYCEWRSGRTN